jgi:hypothetical protein
MRSDLRRRAPGRARAAAKATMLEQLTVLILGACALLGFLLTA